ncbi:hypothetical protein Y032_0006g2867 [Ancylostoma ceylanicum]|uniref:Uncharacterized protein n=1 Tax=Ancylostoma ceylanicum TaxID=53326 RepID=A0A016VNS8_9BILA|nr:hypothetical protein Y032_0006g2867 [Ancylostoma ceylanicum]
MAMRFLVWTSATKVGEEASSTVAAIDASGPPLGPHRSECAVDDELEEGVGAVRTASALSTPSSNYSETAR